MSLRLLELILISSSDWLSHLMNRVSVPMMQVVGLVLLVTVAVEGRIFCPEIGLLGSPTNLICIEASRTYSFITPSGTPAAACDTSSANCIPTGNFTASVHNTTTSVLTILALLESHAGIWKCSSDGDMTDASSCQMTVAKFPTCTITRRQYDGSDFTVDEEVALGVNVTGYYCSNKTQFQLQTGNIQTDLHLSQCNATTDVIFNLTVSHLGDVKLAFTCGGYRHESSCEGIQQLKLVSSSTTPTPDTSVSIVLPCSVSILFTFVMVISSLIFLYKRHHRHRNSRTVNAVQIRMSGDVGYSTTFVVDGAVSWANATNRSLPPTPEVPEDTINDPGYPTMAVDAVNKAKTVTTDGSREEGSSRIVNPDDKLKHVKSTLSAPVGDYGSPIVFEFDTEGKQTSDNKVLNSESQSQSIMFADPGYTSLEDVIVTKSRSTSERGSCTGGTSPIVIPKDIHEDPGHSSLGDVTGGTSPVVIPKDIHVKDGNGATPDVSELYAKVVKTRNTTEPEDSGVSVVVLK